MKSLVNLTIILAFLERGYCRQTSSDTESHAPKINPCNSTNNRSVKADCNQNTSEIKPSSKSTSRPVSRTCQSSNTSPRHKILACFSILVLITGILGNTLAIFVIQASNELRKRVAYTFVMSLAIADLGVSLFVTSMKVDKYLNDGSFCHGFVICTLNHVTDSLFPIISISQMALIGIDRWIAIARPYKYVSLVSHSKGRGIVIVVWLYAFVWTALGSISWQYPYTLAYKLQSVGRQRYCYSLNKYYHTTLDCFIYILPIFITTVLYLDILRIAWNKECRYNGPLRRKRKWRQYADIKATRTVAAVFFAYTFCWLPHFIIVIFYYWMPTVIKNFYLHDPQLYDIVTTVVSNILPTFNSCLNPFIYFLVGRQFRMTLYDLYCKMLGRSRPSALAVLYSTSNDTNDVKINSYWRNKLLMGQKRTNSGCEGEVVLMATFGEKI